MIHPRESRRILIHRSVIHTLRALLMKSPTRERDNRTTRASRFHSLLWPVSGPCHPPSRFHSRAQAARKKSIQPDCQTAEPRAKERPGQARWPLITIHVYQIKSIPCHDFCTIFLASSVGYRPGSAPPRFASRKSSSAFFGSPSCCQALPRA